MARIKYKMPLYTRRKLRILFLIAWEMLKQRYRCVCQSQNVCPNVSSMGVKGHTKDLRESRGAPWYDCIPLSKRNLFQWVQRSKWDRFSLPIHLKTV